MYTLYMHALALKCDIYLTGPFKRSYDTTSDFWRMIFQERCETLVMLTQPMEDGVSDYRSSCLYVRGCGSGGLTQLFF